MQQYITIAEYARLKGISKQAVYKQLKNGCYSTATTNRGKVISIKHLSDNERLKINPDNVVLETETIESCNQSPEDSTTLQQMVEILRDQLAAKDQQITALTAAVTKLTDRLAGEQALHASTAQQLQAAQEQLRLLSAPPVPANEPPAPPEPEPEPPPAEPAEPANVKPSKKYAGLLQRVRNIRRNRG